MEFCHTSVLLVAVGTGPVLLVWTRLRGDVLSFDALYVRKDLETTLA